MTVFTLDKSKKQLKKKINFIVEKPLCSTEKELKQFYKLIKKNKEIKFTSNLVLRYNDLFQNIKKKINKKKIYYIEADYLWGRKEKLFSWRSKDRNYSFINGAAIHMIDLINWFLEKKPLKVFCSGNKKSTISSKFKKDSFIILQLFYAKNLIVKITANASCVNEHFHELKIYESNKTFIHNSSETVLYQRNRNMLIKKKLAGNYPDRANKSNLIKDFINSIINRKKFSIKQKYLIDLMSICFAAQKSLIQNKIIKIRYLK